MIGDTSTTPPTSYAAAVGVALSRFRGSARSPNARSSYPRGPRPTRERGVVAGWPAPDALPVQHYARRVAPEPFHVMTHHRLDVRLAVLDPRHAAAPPVAAVVVHRNVGVELVRDVRRERDEERRVQRVAVRHDQRRPADVRVVGGAATQAQDAHGVTPARAHLVHLALRQRGAPVARQSDVLPVGRIEHRASATRRARSSGRTTAATAGGTRGYSPAYPSSIPRGTGDIPRRSSLRSSTTPSRRPPQLWSERNKHRGDVCARSRTAFFVVDVLRAVLRLGNEY